MRWFHDGIRPTMFLKSANQISTRMPRKPALWGSPVIQPVVVVAVHTLWRHNHPHEVSLLVEGWKSETGGTNSNPGGLLRTWGSMISVEDVPVALSVPWLRKAEKCRASASFLKAAVSVSRPTSSRRSLDVASRRSRKLKAFPGALQEGSVETLKSRGTSSGNPQRVDSLSGASLPPACPCPSLVLPVSEKKRK